MENLDHTVLKRDWASSPRSQAAVDAMNEKYAEINDGSEHTTAFLVTQEIRVTKAANDIGSDALAGTETLEAKINAAAKPLNQSSTIREVQSDTEQHRIDAAQAAAPIAETLAAREASKIQFEAKEALDTGIDPDYAVHPSLSKWLALPFLAFVAEVAAITAYVGPFTPGGRLQALLVALTGGGTLAILAFALGYFALRAWNVNNTLLRVAARGTAAVSILAAKGVLAFITAYRTSLEKNVELWQAFHHLDSNSAWPVLASVIFFLLTVRTARGGGDMPYPVYWKREVTDRPYRLSLEEIQASQDHFRDTLIHDIYMPAIELVRKTVPAAEAEVERVEQDVFKATVAMVNSERELRDIYNTAVSDHALYVVEFNDRWPLVRFAPFGVPQPELPDNAARLRAAVEAAHKRLSAMRRDAADLERTLTVMREEAVQQLDRMFADMRERATTAQEEENDNA